MNKTDVLMPLGQKWVLCELNKKDAMLAVSRTPECVILPALQAAPEDTERVSVIRW